MKFIQRRKAVAVFTLLCIIALASIIITQYDSRVDAVDPSTYKNLKVFNEVLDMVENNYVEKVDPKTLLQEAMNGMMKSLDPHSSYLTAEMYKELQSVTSGSFGGVGIEITMQKDILTVVSPIEDSPAYNAGLQAGDQIVKIDNESTKGLTIDDAVNKMRGPEGSQVKLGIMRKGWNEPKDFTLTRAVINIKSVRYRNFEGNIGYIRITSFQERTADDIKKALSEIGKKANPLAGLVIDVRNNPGGLLDQAVKVSDIFLKQGTIVSIMGRSKSLESKYVARNDGIEPNCPIVVLINEGSASAAEILAGALQDNGKAIVLGTQSFGKGSVQTVIPFEDGSALKLTTARYYTPKGRSIQAEGISPDIVVEYIKPPEEKDQDIIIRERDLRGHIKGENENPEKEKVSKPGAIAKRDLDDITKDNQLKSAVDLLKSWEIFGKLGGK